ncbi:MAG: IS110 family transposase, partial [Verrucomicrobia bacterium]|nr:IS110 family transposase [Verrucomicrobiota bacterium]
MKKVIAGMDLHSNNVVIGVMDLDGQRLASRKLPRELKEVVKFLAPYRKRLEQVAVESTYNWYWLVDGLRALNYPVVLANP